MIDINNLKKIIENNKAVFGTKETLEMVKKKAALEGVFVASNCPEEIKAKFSELKVNVQNSEKTNKELGILCRKGFDISVIGIKK